MKIPTALFLTVLLLLASFGVAHAKALFADDLIVAASEDELVMAVSSKRTIVTTWAEIKIP